MAAAGWFPDPHDPARLRWWDGNAWTEHTHPAAAPPTAEPPTLPARAAIAAIVGVAASVIAANLAARFVARDVASVPAFEFLVFYTIGFGGIAYTCALASKKFGSGSYASDYGWRFAWSDCWRGPVLYVITFLLQIPVVVLLRPGTHFNLHDRFHAVGPGATAVFALSAIVAAPVFEELVFRGLLQRSLTSRFGIRWAIAIQSVCFGVYHVVPRLGLSNVAYIAPRIVFGAVAGVAAARYRRLGPGVAAHVFTNTLAIVLIAATW